jgi:hypothetical protein
MHLSCTWQNTREQHWSSTETHLGHCWDGITEAPGVRWVHYSASILRQQGKELGLLPVARALKRRNENATKH